jgi:serine/threonine protein kinase
MERQLREIDTVVAGKLDANLPVVLPAAPPAGFDPLARYDYLNAIGEGGMGAVHSVRDNVLRRVIAMKVLAPRLTARPKEITRFEREAQITAQLEHPNIVPVHDLGIAGDGNRYFTMKKIEGRTVRQWIADVGRPTAVPDTLEDMLQVLVRVCDAVAFAHSRGVVHCDLKPENVMVGPFGQVYVMDWGLATVVKRVVGAGNGVDAPISVEPVESQGPFGTPAFMSPEQACGQPVDERTDVFSLGAFLFNILTGAPPFAAEDSRRALAEAQACVLRFPPWDPAAPLPLDLCQIVQKAMSRRPVDRYRTVLDFKRDIELSLRGVPFTSHLYPAGSRIVIEGEPGDSAFIIVRGTCVVYKIVEGERVVLRRLGPGSVFGETAVLSGGIRTATVEAEDEVVVKVVSRRLLEQNLGIDTPFGAFVGALADRFREADSRLAARDGTENGETTT